jgi:hypothetical protein
MVDRVNDDARNVTNSRRPVLGLDIDDAFMGVLDKLRQTNQYSLYTMSDNVSGDGDVHLGAFAPRHFADWLENTCVPGISIATSGEIESCRTGEEIQGWVIIVDWDDGDLHDCIDELRSKIICQIEEIYKSESIQANIERQRVAEEDRNGELRTLLDGAW